MLLAEKKAIAEGVTARRKRVAEERSRKQAEKEKAERAKATKLEELKPILNKLKKYNLVAKSGKVTLGSTRKYLRVHTECPAKEVSSLTMDNILTTYDAWASDSEVEATDGEE